MLLLVEMKIAVWNGVICQMCAENIRQHVGFVVRMTKTLCSWLIIKNQKFANGLKQNQRELKILSSAKTSIQLTCKAHM